MDGKAGRGSKSLASSESSREGTFGSGDQGTRRGGKEEEAAVAEEAGTATAGVEGDGGGTTLASREAEEEGRA